MSERSALVLRTAWLAEPGVWIWEIAEAGGEIVESCWTAGWLGFDTEEDAEHAGLGRLATLRTAAGGNGAVEPGGGARPIDPMLAMSHRSPRGRLIVVPRSRATLYRALKRSFEDDENVEVVLDRRFRERRASRRRQEPERRSGDRRRRADVDAQLAAGCSVTIPVTGPRTHPFDADGRAILVLLCSEHVVGCRACEQTYRIRWLRRSEGSSFACPGCGADVTLEVARHTYACGYWLDRSPRRSLLPSAPTEAGA